MLFAVRSTRDGDSHAKKWIVAMTDRNIAVETIGLGKSYGKVVALRSVDLRIQSGQYFVLLGPSGGGKTTLLRLVGGFIRPSSGRVLLHGIDMSEVPPNLRLRKLAKQEVSARVDRMLTLVGLEGLHARMPHELSGGQQQRVQLARALVLESDILLLDEPLASLDANLRQDMCLELKRIQEEVGITFIHVTHNQEEAMTIADRIALIADGALVEEGTPREIYERPKTRFTADFIGENNIFEGTVASVIGGRVIVDLGFTRIAVPCGEATAARGEAVSFSVRSELLELGDDVDAAESRDVSADPIQTVPATYLKEVYLGLTTSHMVRLPDQRNVVVRGVSTSGQAHFAADQAIFVRWRTDDARLLNG